jgi:hypothetical protein
MHEERQEPQEQQKHQEQQELQEHQEPTASDPFPSPITEHQDHQEPTALNQPPPSIIETTKQTKRPTPIDTTHSSTIDIAKITPPSQTGIFNNEALGRWAPRHSPVTDVFIERTYQNILRGDLGTDLTSFKPTESDPDYDVRRYLTSVQLALLRTLNDDHQERIIEAIREDVGGIFVKEADGQAEVKGYRKDDEEFKAEIFRCR